ncbi:sialate O-acetylesterase [Microbacterium sp. Se63.02b]|uniref:sialate O-acetylesterase n=2 Tax=unclassified Microbacterium TaxID=2609290 RepID=UPI001AEDC310|nr:sialate O-acetylesterase [Microbacterium sp. Se63.02b]
MLPIGEFEAAGDLTTAANINQPGAASQAAVDARVQGVAADIIAGDGTVKAAAAAAVTADIATRSIIESKQLGLEDLNAVTAPGLYGQATAANATLARNYPMAGGTWTIEVVKVNTTATAVVQRAARVLSGETRVVVWERRLAAGVGAWVRVGFSHLSLATEDLNTITSPGLYGQSTTGSATLARNYPVAGGTGILTVEAVNPTATFLVQRYAVVNTTDGVKSIWMRTVLTTGAVTSWVRIDGGGGGGSDGGEYVSRVIVLVGCGQSNMEGRGRPFSAFLDPVDNRIRMWEWGSSSLTTATVPLSSRQQQTGLSVLTVMAREILRADPRARVVIVNAGVGGTGLVTKPTAGTWNISDPESLYPAAKAAAVAAKAAAETLFGVPAAQVVWAWHQGEGDAGTSRAAYEAALDALVADFRATIPDAIGPIVGGMIPEYVTANATLAPVALAHLDTPRRLVGSAYAPAPLGGGGSADVGDTVHFHRTGVEQLGKRMYTAIERAASNLADSTPHQPLNVAAAFNSAGNVDVTWTPPLTRAIGYLVEYRPNGTGSWLVATRGEPLEPGQTITGLSAPFVDVRVSTVGESATSAPAATVRVIA